jgi:hypothetical protein
LQRSELDRNQAMGRQRQPSNGARTPRIEMHDRRSPV